MCEDGCELDCDDGWVGPFTPCKCPCHINLADIEAEEADHKNQLEADE